jgi:hypothetical protein
MTSVMNWIDTPNSSNVVRYGYGWSKEINGMILYVEFKGNKTYAYTGVSMEVWDNLQKAESVGRFIGSDIKGKFEYQLLAPEVPDGS